MSDHEDKTGLNKFKLEFSENLFKAMNELVVDLTVSTGNLQNNQLAEKPKG